MKATVGIPVASKKRYRLTTDELISTRNLAALFAQLWPTFKLKFKVEEAARWEKEFVSGKIVDDDFVAFLEHRPSRVAVSMLRTQKEEAEKQEHEKQTMIHSEVAAQKQAVEEAEWKFFELALRQDQAMLQRVQSVPMKVKAALHAKSVQHRKEQAEAGQKATQGYQDLDRVLKVMLAFFSHYWLQ